MRAVEFVENKRDGKIHTSTEIRDFVLAYAHGDLPDYQMSAWLMAVVWRGLNDSETLALTDAMLCSGGKLDLSGIPGTKVDKHSTGGVGDKVTLAVVPLLAAGGVAVAKMSGRGLGHTGGTLDKLESIPGFRVALSKAEIVAQVGHIGACICAQTDDLVPADRLMYALRDVTGTVESLPLIAASIMSKKLACGADAILLDVKVGRGAFMKSVADANALAKMLVHIGAAYGKIVDATLTSMDIPLGRAVGNWLEVLEVTNLLKGANSDNRLRAEVIELAGKGLTLAAKGDCATAERLLADRSGWRKLTEMIEAQGGDAKTIGEDRHAPVSRAVVADTVGFVIDINALAIGRAAMMLGAGRHSKEGLIDPLAGVWLDAQLGDAVALGDTLATLHARSEADADAAVGLVRDAYRFARYAQTASPLVLGEISNIPSL